MWLGIMLVQESDNSSFFEIHDFISPGGLARFSVLVKISHLSSRPSIRLESCWLPPNVCTTIAFLGVACHVGLVIVSVHRHQSWVYLLVASLTWKLIWHLLASGKLIFREAVFRPNPAQIGGPVFIMGPQIQLSQTDHNYTDPLHIGSKSCCSGIPWASCHQIATSVL